MAFYNNHSYCYMQLFFFLQGLNKKVNNNNSNSKNNEVLFCNTNTSLIKTRYRHANIKCTSKVGKNNTIMCCVVQKIELIIKTLSGKNMTKGVLKEALQLDIHSSSWQRMQSLIQCGSYLVKGFVTIELWILTFVSYRQGRGSPIVYLSATSF